MAVSTPSKDVPDIAPTDLIIPVFKLCASQPLYRRGVPPLYGLKIREGSAMTYHPKSEFIAIMMERGYLADCTDYQGLDEALSNGIVQPISAMMRLLRHFTWGICSM
jgi:hypothetical protein